MIDISKFLGALGLGSELRQVPLLGGVLPTVDLRYMRGMQYDHFDGSVVAPAAGQATARKTITRTGWYYCIGTINVTTLLAASRLCSMLIRDISSANRWVESHMIAAAIGSTLTFGPHLFYLPEAWSIAVEPSETFAAGETIQLTMNLAELYATI